MKRVTIYTDGACSGNPGPGGWGAILIFGNNRREMSGYEPETTNNRMELMAAIMAMRALKEPCEIDLYSDSSYLVDAFKKGWLKSWHARGWIKADKKPVKNQELWEELLSLSNTHVLHLIHVKGHADNPMNNRCDEMATGIIKQKKAAEAL
ncbi:MAG: ribonuclease HI [Clostridiales bacterium]|nr:ribonuclease HI [Clostridiales bacterium]